MRIQCDMKFWKKVRTHNDCEHENLKSYDGKVLMSALWIDEIEDPKPQGLMDTTRVIKFVSNNPGLDPIDMPVTEYVVVDEDNYFNTETFQAERGATITNEPKENTWEDVEPKRENPEATLPDKNLVSSAEIKGEYLKITFSNGLTRLVDCNQYLKDYRDTTFDNCPQEQAVKLIGSLNNDLRRLFKGGEIKEDIHVSNSDRLVDTLNKVLMVGDELREQQKQIIDRIISSVKAYEEGDFGMPGCVAKEKLAKRIVNLLLKAHFPEYLELEKDRHLPVIKSTLIRALTMSELQNDEVIARNTSAEK